MLAMANYFRGTVVQPLNNYIYKLMHNTISIHFVVAKNYWAKDLIFLVTSHESIGMQAWIDKYLGLHSGIPTYLQWNL